MTRPNAETHQKSGTNARRRRRRAESAAPAEPHVQPQPSDPMTLYAQIAAEPARLGAAEERIGALERRIHDVECRLDLLELGPDWRRHDGLAEAVDDLRRSLSRIGVRG